MPKVIESSNLARIRNKQLRRHLSTQIIDQLDFTAEESHTSEWIRGGLLGVLGDVNQNKINLPAVVVVGGHLTRNVTATRQTRVCGKGFILPRSAAGSKLFSVDFQQSSMTCSWRAGGETKSIEVPGNKPYGFTASRITESTPQSLLMIGVHVTDAHRSIPDIVSHKRLQLGRRLTPIITIARPGHENSYFLFDGSRVQTGVSAGERVQELRAERDSVRLRSALDSFSEAPQVKAIEDHLVGRFRSGESFLREGRGVIVGTDGDEGSCVVAMTNSRGTHQFSSLTSDGLGPLEHNLGPHFANQPIIADFKGGWYIARSLDGEPLRVDRIASEMGHEFKKLPLSHWNGLNIVLLREMSASNRRPELNLGFTRYVVPKTRWDAAREHFGLRESQVSRQALLVRSDPRQRDDDGRIGVEIKPVLLDNRGKLHWDRSFCVDYSVGDSTLRKMRQDEFQPEFVESLESASTGLLTRWPIRVARFVDDTASRSIEGIGEFQAGIVGNNDAGSFLAQSVRETLRGFVHYLNVASDFERERRIISELIDLSQRVGVLQDITRPEDRRRFVFTRTRRRGEFSISERDVTKGGIPKGLISFRGDSIDLSTWRTPVVVRISQTALEDANLGDEAKLIERSLPDGMFEPHMEERLSSDPVLAETVNRGWEIAGETSKRVRDRPSRSRLSLRHHTASALECSISAIHSGGIAVKDVGEWLGRGRSKATLLLAGDDLLEFNGLCSAEEFTEWKNALRAKVAQKIV